MKKVDDSNEAGPQHRAGFPPKPAIMITVVRNIFLILSVLGIMIGLPWHLATYNGIDMRQYSWLLWFAIQMASGLVVLGLFLSKYLAPDVKVSSGLLSRTMVAAGCFWFYAFFNWSFTNAYFSDNALSEIVNGRYVLYSHGQIVRHLTALEYKAQLVYECRYFPDIGWLFFSPLSPCLDIRKKKE